MSAQHGSTIVLDYGPQGAQQAGDALVLDYSSAAPPARRRVVGGLHAPWPAARAMATDMRAPYESARPVDDGRRAPWGRGRSVESQARGPWVVPEQRGPAIRAHWGWYALRPERAVQAPWALPQSADLDRRAPWGRFAERPTDELRAPWRLALPLDHERTAPWGRFAAQMEQPLVAPWLRGPRADIERWLPWLRYSRQINPGWGVVVPDGSPPVDEHGTVLVPVRRSYIVINTINLVRVSDGAVIPAYNFSMSLDTDSWTWSWSATLPASALPIIQPTPGGDPVDVQVAINGTPYRLCVEQYGRQREFANTRISVRGRGRAAVLDAPYAPILNHGNTAARTAQQLMDEVLTVNGVGIGWAVDFALTDWLVPGNTWVHHGSYISALLEIAAAAGGYVQPHDTAQTLHVLPRYPTAPWQWHTITPDFELPSAVVSVEGTEWQRKAAYNRVHVSGTTAGVLGEVTRGGTAGDVVAPMITDVLITHVDAARQRGMAVLADTGAQAHISLRLPVLEETGIIPPGKFVRYQDNGEEIIGITRSVSVDAGLPEIWQVIGVETHVEPV